MRKTIKTTALSLILSLLLAGCGTGTQPPADITGTTAATETTTTSADVSSAADDGGTTSTRATQTTATTTETPAPEPEPLPDGMLVWSEDFDDYVDSTLLSNFPRALGWTAVTTRDRVRFAVIDGRLFFDNFDKVGAAASSLVFVPDALSEEVQAELSAYRFTLQYDIEYTAGTDGSAYAGMIRGDTADGLPRAETAGTAVTVRLRYDPETGYHVYQSTADGFVKVGEPLLPDEYGIALHLGAVEGYLDNLRLWIGHGDAPDANVPCYWQTAH